MNYYNPYYFTSPVGMTTSPSGISGFFGRSGLTLGSILNGAQRTLGLVNQAIPIIKEAAPVMKNAKTMFRVMNEFKKIDSPVGKKNVSDISDDKNASADLKEYSNENGPTFFL